MIDRLWIKYAPLPFQKVWPQVSKAESELLKMFLKCALAVSNTIAGYEEEQRLWIPGSNTLTQNDKWMRRICRMKIVYNIFQNSVLYKNIYLQWNKK